jgi:hypothetical protein
VTRKTRNAGWGSATWLGDEWVEAIARGEHASPEAARELADEVLRYRRCRRMLIEDVRDFAEIIEARHGVRAAGLLRVVAVGLCTADELYGDRPARPPTEDPHGCPPTDTPPSDASGDPPPRARSSG